MESPSVSNRSADQYCYRLDLAYVGAQFMGWQSQPNRATVQDHLEAALRTCLREKVSLMGASRTDTGVHAEHQVASFRSSKPIDCFRVLRSLQALVPDTIGIYSLEPCSEDFHPIFQAQAKLYRYRLWQGTAPSPFAKPYVWVLPQTLSVSRMESASLALLGHHDFRSFCASDRTVQTFERTIFDIRWLQHGSLLEFYILGDGFLKQMVRSIVGTLVDVGVGKRTAQDMQGLVLAKDRTRAGQTAPAQGLSLVRIFYESQTSIPTSSISEKNFLSFTLGPQVPG